MDLTVVWFMTIPFTKAEAVGNDFLIVEWNRLSALGLEEADLADFASRICDRHLGVGADGLEVLGAPCPEPQGVDAFIRVFNSDGSEAEISGNGTRCVAASLMADSHAGESLRIGTRAGVKELRLLERRGVEFLFDMTMGRPRYSDAEVDCRLETELGVHQVTLVDVGNPQCVMMVEEFPSEWRRLGRVIETHDRFSQGTNVSFVKKIDDHHLAVRFWERGAGETISSGTGSTGAAVAAILLGRARSPVTVATPSGKLQVTWDGEVVLRGAATIIAQGEYCGVPKKTIIRRRADPGGARQGS